MYTLDSKGLFAAYNSLLTKSYEHSNAEELYNFINKVKSLVKVSLCKDVHQWVKKIGEVLKLTAITEYKMLVEILTIKVNDIRVCFDEEFAELQFDKH